MRRAPQSAGLHLVAFERREGPSGLWGRQYLSGLAQNLGDDLLNESNCRPVPLMLRFLQTGDEL